MVRCRLPLGRAVSQGQPAGPSVRDRRGRADRRGRSERSSRRRDHAAGSRRTGALPRRSRQPRHHRCQARCPHRRRRLRRARKSTRRRQHESRCRTAAKARSAPMPRRAWPMSSAAASRRSPQSVHVASLAAERSPVPVGSGQDGEARCDDAAGRCPKVVHATYESRDRSADRRDWAPNMTDVPPADDRPEFWVKPFLRFLGREWPYLVMLVLALFGVAYTSVTRRPITLYWFALAPFIGIICVMTRWSAATGPRRATASGVDAGASLGGGAGGDEPPLRRRRRADDEHRSRAPCTCSRCSRWARSPRAFISGPGASASSASSWHSGFPRSPGSSSRHCCSRS